MDTYTAFAGHARIAAGPLPKVALALKHGPMTTAPVVIFSDSTGRPIDIDLRGSDREILARLAGSAPTPAEPAPSEPRGRGRPRLGVVAREVTLLPEHWEWLGAQPGGASVALRKLVHEARRASGDKDRAREARDAAYHFMSTMGGNLPNFEEASRALFADDLPRVAALIVDWPADIRDHAMALVRRHRAD
ncbi:hypothetical protein SSBR45G_18300 [Bradyrhizobium sp. SSBR45G]|uniref:DUF2239 family protein n=1 Tax=unclassified Bradyrhizobium TaxID=2631580 RepID=UPI002342B93F|nr:MULTISPECIES: DUF2239 family protein [unclassified Bradyrhizobium]GLH76922.1 hypothetical protein SSBR45G_18300 [Bradyrhizobium sp. SSBR45G]GLH83680.1 hypothetical protein SSBR45R_11400 [Bradyrhizobium sp. SSBR45R]